MRACRCPVTAAARGAMLLAALPDELVRAMLSYATLRDMKSVRATSKRMAAIAMAPPFHTKWQCFVFDSTGCGWASCVTRSVRETLRVETVRTLIPEVLFFAGSRLTVLQLGHRMYPPPTHHFGNTELATVARTCPLLQTFKMFYRDVSFTRGALQNLLTNCLMLHTLAMPFGSARLRAQLHSLHLGRGGRVGGEPWTLRNSFVRTLRLHNLVLGFVTENYSAGRVPAMFASSLTALKLVNVANLGSLNFVVHLPQLRHLTVKHCRRPLHGTVAHLPVAQDPWYRFLAPRLFTLCVVDVDHVVCETRLMQAMLAPSTAFAHLRELRLDGELFFTLPLTSLDVGGIVCHAGCNLRVHRFHTWECMERCANCIAHGPAHLAKLEKLYFYNDSFYKLYDTLA